MTIGICRTKLTNPQGSVDLHSLITLNTLLILSSGVKSLPAGILIILLVSIANIGFEHKTTCDNISYCFVDLCEPLSYLLSKRQVL